MRPYLFIGSGGKANVCACIHRRYVLSAFFFAFFSIVFWNIYLFSYLPTSSLYIRVFAAAVRACIFVFNILLFVLASYGWIMLPPTQTPKASNANAWIRGRNMLDAVDCAHATLFFCCGDYFPAWRTTVRAVYTTGWIRDFVLILQKQRLSEKTTDYRYASTHLYVPSHPPSKKVKRTHLKKSRTITVTEALNEQTFVYAQNNHPSSFNEANEIRWIRFNMNHNNTARHFIYKNVFATACLIIISHVLWYI